MATLACLVAALTVVLPASLEAFQGVPKGRWWQDPQVAEQAGLSADQVTQIKAIYLNHQKRMAALKTTVERRQGELQQLLAAAKFDRQAADAKANDLVDTRAKLDRERMATLAEVRAVLSADQYAKLRTMHGQRRGGPRGPRARVQGGGDTTGQ